MINFKTSIIINFSSKGMMTNVRLQINSWVLKMLKGAMSILENRANKRVLITGVTVVSDGILFQTVDTSREEI